MPKDRLMIQPAEFRKLRLLLRTFEVQLALIPLVGLAFWFGSKFAPLFWFWALWLVSFVVVIALIAEWRCPACGKTFFKKSENDRAWLYADRCAHCGIRRPRLGFLD
jgi:predicted RNA-binding Zn-ribbon protein involved in translation (DUF1610 family)